MKECADRIEPSARSMNFHEDSISPRDYARLCNLIYQEAGIHLSVEKKTMLEGRIKRRLKVLNLVSYRQYCDYLFDGNGRKAEVVPLIDVVTTNKTDFFREPRHFEFLAREVLPELMGHTDARGAMFWSAGCSTGEEPYSIAITLCDALKFAEAWEIEILATDISRRALRHAERGAYSKRSLQELSLRQVETHFTAAKNGFHVKPRIRKMISFAQMNLAEPMYLGKMDCIFCMNVLMYFTEQRRLAILRGFYEALEPGGYFMLGHSETLTHMPLKFEAVTLGDCRLYRKPVAAEASRAVAMVEGSL